MWTFYSNRTKRQARHLSDTLVETSGRQLIAKQRHSLIQASGYMVTSLAYPAAGESQTCLYIPKEILPDSHKGVLSNVEIGGKWLLRGLKIVQDSLAWTWDIPAICKVFVNQLVRMFNIVVDIFFSLSGKFGSRHQWPGPAQAIAHPVLLVTAQSPRSPGPASAS